MLHCGSCGSTVHFLPTAAVTSGPQVFAFSQLTFPECQTAQDVSRQIKDRYSFIPNRHTDTQTHRHTPMCLLEDSLVGGKCLVLASC